MIGTLLTLRVCIYNTYICRLGVGSILPKDIVDGSFTRRIPTSNDKLLEQLLGKKKAKAHLAAQQEAARPNAKAQKYGKLAPVSKQESDDEEDGRAAAFQSKRFKRDQVPKKKVQSVESDDEDEEERAKRVGKTGGDEVPEEEAQIDTEPPKEDAEVDDDVVAEKTAPRKSRAKPKSFLDEILAERSKKASRKKSKTETEA